MIKKIFSSVVCALFLSLTSSVIAAPVLYDNIPTPTPANLPSLGYEATSTRQFGNKIMLSMPGTSALDQFTVAMSNWAYKSAYPNSPKRSGFDVDLTLNIYAAAAADAVGALLFTQTITTEIPWRPEPAGDCSGTAYRASDGNCYNGSLSLHTFNMGGLNVNQEFIYGLSFNTQHHGYQPTGVSGPYNSLNFALNTTNPFIGSNSLPGTAYWDTTHAPFYGDGGTGGVGVFRLDSGWSPYSGAVRVTGDQNVPEPTSLGLLGIGLVFAANRLRRRRA